MDLDRPFLCIPDLQIPFEHPRALEFIKYLKAHYKIPSGNMICLGDELDEYCASEYEHDPNGIYTAATEIEASVDRLQEWYANFPIMRVAISNHGERWYKKATKCGIPSLIMKRYRDWIKAPNTWVWEKKFIIGTRRPFLVTHGDDWGGQAPHVQAALHNGMSTIMGHHHSKCMIEHIETAEQKLWGCVSGSLIDFPKYAFNYARKHPKHPVIGATIIFNNGTTPIFIPLT